MQERRNKKQTKKLLQNKKERQKERTKRERIHYNTEYYRQKSIQRIKNELLEIKNDI